MKRCDTGSRGAAVSVQLDKQQTRCSPRPEGKDPAQFIMGKRRDGIASVRGYHSTLLASGNVRTDTVVPHDSTAPLKHTHEERRATTQEGSQRVMSHCKAAAFPSHNGSTRRPTAGPLEPRDSPAHGSKTKHIHSSAALEFKSGLFALDTSALVGCITSLS